AMGEKIVYEEVQLRDHANVVSGALIDRYNSLHSNLEVFTGPDDPGVYCASRLSLCAAVQWTFERKLHQRNQPIEWRVQVHILHLRLQVDHAVLEGKAPLQHVGMTFDLNGAFASLHIRGDTAC